MDGARRHSEKMDMRHRCGRVSILVLMDGARRHRIVIYGLVGNLVSILVLMDGARRRLGIQHQASKWRSFNPCFDGWGSPTPGPAPPPGSAKGVSILVLMDGARRLSQSLPDSRPGKVVSILVLMDGARRQHLARIPPHRRPGFNPCFDGWGSPT